MKRVLAEGLDYNTNDLRVVTTEKLRKYIEEFRAKRKNDEILDLSRIKLSGGRSEDAEIELSDSGKKENTGGASVCVENKQVEEENRINLAGEDFSFVDFSWSDFQDVDFHGADFSNSVLDHARFVNTDFHNAVLKDASLYGADLRGCDLSYTDCDGTVFTASILIGANLEGLKDTERTVHFKMACPETGYFFGYKKCFNDRMVQLLIPADAKRCSSTTNACRCDKAITVAIMNPDKTGFYTEATSFVDGDFTYRLGEMSYADSYHEDRWLDSSHGIHFWMTFEEALGYM